MNPLPAANQKRKRGRPANASNSTTTTVAEDKQHENRDEGSRDAMDESSHPRRRGRPTKDKVEKESTQIQTQTQPTRQTRRQSPAIQAEDNSPVDPASEHSAPGEIQAKKRGRPKKGDPQSKVPEPEAEEADDENEHENEGNSSLLRRSQRNRRSLDESPPISEDTPTQREASKTLLEKATRGRKRTIQHEEQEQPSEEAEPEPNGETEASSGAQMRRKKRRHPSHDRQPPLEEAELQSEPEPEPEPESALVRKKRRRAIQDGPSRRGKQTVDEEPHGNHHQNRSSRADKQSKSRRRSSDGQDESLSRSSSPVAASPPPLPYRHIARRTRRVTQEVIESEWSSLDHNSLVNIATLFHSVSQPTLLHVAPKQYADAEDVLEKVIRGLCRRSARLPFPPASTLPRREDELDFERTQSAVEVLMSQLDPLQHSVELLRREKDRAERELEREYKLLERLSTNARAEARERRDQLRKVHVLVPEKTSTPATDTVDLLPVDKGVGKLFSGVQDEELLSLGGQISNHMESMRGNLHQIDGALPAIAESHALLRTTLQPHFDQKQFEHIILG